MGKRLFWSVSVVLIFASAAMGQTIWWETGMVKLRMENGGPEGDPVPKNADLCQGGEVHKGRGPDLPRRRMSLSRSRFSSPRRKTNFAVSMWR
ncbi:MAG: hypothetical protein MPW15_11985 [Candidatus Manganitrophus sp.]|nr:hypothetical protein [Candidatus Manganitrophus sp.]